MKFLQRWQPYIPARQILKVGWKRGFASNESPGLTAISWSSNRKAAISVFCLALLVRVVYNLTVARYYTPQHDSLFYYTIGLHILNEHCFCLQAYLPTVYRAPLWPAIIAGIVTILGQHDYLPRYFLCLV